jgi:hypothetical protein
MTEGRRLPLRIHNDREAVGQLSILRRAQDEETTALLTITRPGAVGTISPALSASGARLPTNRVGAAPLCWP